MQALLRFYSSFREITGRYVEKVCSAGSYKHEQSWIREEGVEGTKKSAPVWQFTVVQLSELLHQQLQTNMQNWLTLSTA